MTAKSIDNLIEESHSIANAKATIETMVEDFKKDQLFEKSNDYNQQDELRESILNSVLSVEFRSGWYSSPESIADLRPEEFRILLAWGGPALRIIGELDDYGPINPKLQHQDWGTPWTDFKITEDQQKALNWFCNCFYLGG